MSKCVVLGMEDKINFETKLNELLNGGYKIESSSCNSKCYKAILVLNVNESDIFPTANDAKKLVEENVTNFNTPEINYVKEKILKAISDCKTSVEIKLSTKDFEKQTYEFLNMNNYCVHVYHEDGIYFETRLVYGGQDYAIIEW